MTKHLQLSDSPLVLGLVTTLQFVLIMLLSLYGGVLADHLLKRRTLIAMQTCRTYRLQSSCIGEAMVLPDDIVLGTPSGVIFIPPHLVLEVVETAENIQLCDTFGKYTLDEMDVPVWPEHIEVEYQTWWQGNEGNPL